MRGFREVLSVAVVGAALLGGFLPTEAHADAAAVRGRFVRLAEKQVGEREYLAVVVQPGEGKEEVMLLMPRGSEQAAQARKLRKGQLVEIAYVTEAGQKWLKRLRAGSEAAQLQEQIRKLQQRLEQMERELKLLREENALLKKALQARKAANSPAEE